MKLDMRFSFEHRAQFDGFQHFHQKGEPLVFQEELSDQIETTSIDARLEGETVCLSLNQLAELFQVDKSGISRHLKNIFESEELVRDSVVAKFATTAVDGKTYQVEHFNLDAIISVGYRVKSRVVTHFR
ncbi:MAG: RhuM family protein [Desulfovibrio sp.]|uniref:RhuM family protein n=1 Tax=Desulfovibrio sp. 7SRBS1 TaxID=3378064 RepID=UPI003B3DED2F